MTAHHHKVPEPRGHPPRPKRPEWSDRWKKHDSRYTQVTNNWNSNNRTVINNFQINRHTEWNSVHRHSSQSGWHRQYGTSSYRSWRRDTWSYRGRRCNEVWYRTAPYNYHDQFFNSHWWDTCWWRPRLVVYNNYSPWWSWRPVAWASVGYFFGQALAPKPVVYDPGTTVIYEGDTIYVNGKSAGDATQYRRNTIALANPRLDEIPVPEPPQYDEGGEEFVDDPDRPQGDWLPVGVWALTQEEQGDATMFFQLSIDKDGIVGGAFKNVMTGDEQPVVGQLDFESQRVAWHIGDVTETVYETGLSNLENDVASVFVYFGEEKTQTWLIVRMPSPEMPPETVKLPEIAER
ncbi:MAG: hypothetical protein ACR2RV_29425 [Verrucomicrobiales bacterium]